LAIFKDTETVKKLIGGVKNLTTQSLQLATDITKLTTYFEGLTAQQKTDLIALVVNHGYDQSEIQTLYTQLKTLRDQINTTIVNKSVEPNY